MKGEIVINQYINDLEHKIEELQNKIYEQNLLLKEKCEYIEFLKKSIKDMR